MGFLDDHLLHSRCEDDVLEGAASVNIDAIAQKIDSTLRVLPNLSAHFFWRLPDQFRSDVGLPQRIDSGSEEISDGFLVLRAHIIGIRTAKTNPGAAQIDSRCAHPAFIDSVTRL